LSDIDTGATWAALEVMLVVDDKLFEISIHLIHPGQIMFQHMRDTMVPVVPVDAEVEISESSTLTPEVSQLLF